MKACATGGCEKPARMATKVTRPQRENVIITVYTDERAAKVPPLAVYTCNEHGHKTVQSLLDSLVDLDD